MGAVPGSDVGSPILQKYGFREYNAHPQIWSITQDRRGLLYFVTYHADELVEFDGVDWRILPVQGEFLSVVMGPDDRLYLSGMGEIGRLGTDAVGSLVYRSLTDQVGGDGLLESQEIIAVSTSRDVYFQSDDAIYRWRDDRFKTISVAPERFSSNLQVVRDRVLVSVRETGLHELRGDEMILLPGGELFAEKPIATILPHGDDGLLVATLEDGLFLLADGEVQPFAEAHKDFLERNIVLTGVALPDGGAVFGTQTGGAIRLSSSGTVVQILDPSLGLDATIYCLHLDPGGNLWLGTAQGLYRVELLSPVTFVSNDSAVGGAILDLAIQADSVFLATLRGLYRKSLAAGANIREFELVPEVQTDTWALLPAGDSLLVATYDGVVKLKGDELETINTRPTPTFMLERSRFDSDRIYIGLEEGLGWLQRDGDSWSEGGRFEEIQDDVYSVVEISPTELWLGSQGEVIYRLSLGEDRLRVESVETFGGVGGSVGVHRLGEELVVTSFEGIFEVGDGESGDAVGGRLRPHPRYRIAEGADRRMHSIHQDSTGEIWGASVDQLLRGRPGTDGIVVLKPDASLGRVTNGVVEFKEAKSLGDDLWMFAFDGVYRFDRDEPLPETPPVAALIRRVSHPDTNEIVFGGGATKPAAVPAVTLPFAKNSLRFEFSAPVAREPNDPSFRYRLEGFDEHWSEWGAQTRTEYTNLREGDYTFRVQARAEDGRGTEEATYHFEVATPWFRSWWSYLGQILFAVAMLAFFSRLRSRKLRRANQSLEGEVEKRTLLLQEEKRFVERQARELEEINHRLGEEIAHRQKAEEERWELESRIRQTQKLESLGVLAGGIAHDFNNLLVGMLGNADLALLELPPDAPGRDRVRNVFGAARRAADLCQQMLAYSGKGQFLTAAIDLSQVVEEIRRLLAVSIPKGVRFQMLLAEDLPKMQGDKSQIGQVVMNLLLNASEAIGGGPGLVSVHTGTRFCDREHLDQTYLAEPLPEGDYVFLKVRDTGVGMDEETLEKLFDPFYTTKFAGRGLGLAAALGIIRGHSGAISIDSAEDEGSEFTVYFPVGAAPADTAGDGDGKQRWKASGTILVVDDEEPVRVVAQAMLESMGFQVREAADGLEALAVFDEDPMAVVAVVLDLTMPGLQGGEVFQRLRKRRPDLPIVVSTGFSEEAVLDCCPMDGPAGFLKKPYDTETLGTHLHSVLTWRPGAVRDRRSATTAPNG